MTATLARKVAAEFIGTALLLAVVIGSGIMGERLGGGNEGITLLANSLATGCGLAVLILVMHPVSGAHFNPLVTLVATVRGLIKRSDAAAYLPAQVAGAFAGVAIAHLMFNLPLLAASTKSRADSGQWLGEFVATAGLMLVIGGIGKARPTSAALAVASYITAAYWFTSSTSFANPAATLARAASNTFAGIAPADAGGFLLSQLFGAIVGATIASWMFGAGPTNTSANPR